MISLPHAESVGDNPGVGLLDEEQLERSSVVANNAMNRERNLDGVNSYAQDLGFRPLDFLQSRLSSAGSAAWVDLCCGTGRALIQASQQRLPGLALSGVDLVDFFDPHDGSVTLVAASLREWEPAEAFDLITCVHGLHYVGDKLDVLTRALRWVRPSGRFCGHLDLASVKRVDGTSLATRLRERLRSAGVAYDAKRRLITCDGPRELELGFRYLGADDGAGPNYTGQPAVDSYYACRAEVVS
jgi:SAM-dependent methyltransferase